MEKDGDRGKEMVGIEREREKERGREEGKVCISWFMGKHTHPGNPVFPFALWISFTEIRFPYRPSFLQSACSQPPDRLWEYHDGPLLPVDLTTNRGSSNAKFLVFQVGMKFSDSKNFRSGWYDMDISIFFKVKISYLAIFIYLSINRLLKGYLICYRLYYNIYNQLFEFQFEFQFKIEIFKKK